MTPELPGEGEDVYTDGGLLGSNPSPVGGTWCFVRIGPEGHGPLDRRVSSGLVFPADLGVELVSNNNTEMYAILMAVSELPDGWAGTVHSDSAIALGAWFEGHRMTAVPEILHRAIVAFQRSGRMRNANHRLLQGHPTRADLACGTGKKRDLPVSKWNVLCDTECNRLKDLYRSL